MATATENIKKHQIMFIPFLHIIFPSPVIFPPFFWKSVEIYFYFNKDFNKLQKQLQQFTATVAVDTPSQKTN